MYTHLFIFIRPSVLWSVRLSLSVCLSVCLSLSDRLSAETQQNSIKPVSSTPKAQKPFSS